MAEEYLPGTIGERIRDLRKEAKLNLDEFADILGISSSTLGRYELNKQTISLNRSLFLLKGIICSTL